MKDQMTHAEAVSVIAEQHEEIESLRQQLDLMQKAPHWATHTRVCKQLDKAKAENESLRKANKECAEYFAASQKDLAASQLREQKLREALDAVQQVANRSDGIAGWHLNGNVASWDSILPEVEQALTLPQDTSALEAMVQKAGELMRQRCACFAEQNFFHGFDKAIAIRALPPVKLEDLRK